VTSDDKTGWYSVSVEYKPIPPEQSADRGEWYLQATLIHEDRDPSAGMQTEKTPLARIDADQIDSVELQQAFYTATDNALDATVTARNARANCCRAEARGAAAN